MRKVNDALEEQTNRGLYQRLRRKTIHGLRGVPAKNGVLFPIFVKIG